MTLSNAHCNFKIFTDPATALERAVSAANGKNKPKQYILLYRRVFIVLSAVQYYRLSRPIRRYSTINAIVNFNDVTLKEKH